MADDTIQFKCAKCGSDKFQFPSKNPRPDDVITCAGCGASGRYKDIQAEAMRQAKKEVEKIFKNAFKKWR